MRYHTVFDGVGVDLFQPPCAIDDCPLHHLNIFTDADLGREGHFTCDDGGPTESDFLASHVAIPVEQYRILFGAPPT